MKFPETDSRSASPVAGPSSLGLDRSIASPSKAHLNGNGFAPLAVNGNSTSNGVHKHHKRPLDLPGTTLPESNVDREQFIRLVIQSLKDVGYAESAAMLEAESGYQLEVPQATQFRQYILDGAWFDAEHCLDGVGVTEEHDIWNCRFLIRQHKYVELLEAQRTTEALHVLRDELAPLAPLGPHPEHIHDLSSLIMCAEPDDLRQRTTECIPEWGGSSESSRQRLLSALQHYIPSSVMIPQRRLLRLLEQARAEQQKRCDYHDSKLSPSSYSLYADHNCEESIFPRVTTTVLDVHPDQVWNLQWSHDGAYLATGGKDKTVIIWQISSESEPSTRECFARLYLDDHPDSVGCLAWSPDDTVLLTSSGDNIRIWNAKTGVCDRQLAEHTDTVTSLVWLPDGSGFISASLDKKIISWTPDGSRNTLWDEAEVRITDLAITPDSTKLVAVGMSVFYQDDGILPTATNGLPKPAGHRILIYNFATKLLESSVQIDGELTSVKISKDSKFALLNHSPDEVHLWSIQPAKLLKKYLGIHQTKDVIRSCFGGVDDNLIVSGSQDGKIYVWNRESGSELEILAGHGGGSVNAVAWHPHNTRMFASCSDDHTIRLWEHVSQGPVSDFRTHTVPITSDKGKTRE